MRKRRLVAYAVIVAGCVTILAIPSILSERIGPASDPSNYGNRCTQFVVVQTPSAPPKDHAVAPWKVSITISNFGNYPTELVSGQLDGRFKTGLKSWPVSIAGRVLQPHSSTSLTLEFPVPLPSSQNTQAVWELHCVYQNRVSSLASGLGVLQRQLPAVLQDLIKSRRVWHDQLVARYPENYESMLTNELGWRNRPVRLLYRPRGGPELVRQWRSPSESSPPVAPLPLGLQEVLGKPIILVAVAPADPDALLTNKSPVKMVIKGDLVFYSGLLDHTTLQGVWIKSPDERGRFEMLEIRGADILTYGTFVGSPEEALQRTMRNLVGQSGFAANQSQSLGVQQTNQTSAAAGSAR